MGGPTSYDEYMNSRVADAQAKTGGAPPTEANGAPAWEAPAPANSEAGLLNEERAALQRFYESLGAATSPGGVGGTAPPPPRAKTNPVIERLQERLRLPEVPFWQQDAEACIVDEESENCDYSERHRKDRRTVFMHEDWVRHRSSERFLRNMRSIFESSISISLQKELTFVTMAAVFVTVFNMVFVTYLDFDGARHVGPLIGLPHQTMALPALPFSISLPALSLLLVFRTNTGYSRWNEARTLWGGLVNNCRNVVRQTNTFFPDDQYHNQLKRRMAAETTAFIKALRNFLRGPADDETFRGELYELVDAGLMTPAQADDTMSAKNRPMYCLSAMSATLRKANIPPINGARIDSTISVLVDLTGANERIFKSPIPLVYTRLTSRFLTFYLTLLPLALWQQLGESWNHWATIPAEFMIAFFLFGIEEVGIQIEEPFSILPLETMCDGAIEATNTEMLGAVESGVFETEPTY